MRIFTHNSRGFIGLVTVIMLGAIVLAVGVSTAFIGQTQLLLAGHVDYEYATRALASACVEEATHRLTLDPAYTGGTVPLGSDTCTVTVAGSGATRTITVAATLGGYTNRVTATATRRQNTATTATGWSLSAWAEGNPP